MASKTSPIASGINGLLRIPVVFAGISAGGLTLEGVYRVLTTAFGVIGITTKTAAVQKAADFIPHLAVNVLRPFGNMSNKEVAVSGSVCIAVTIVGWEIINKLSGGKPSDRYNKVAQWVTPITLNTDWRHPVVTWIRGKFFTNVNDKTQTQEGRT